MEVEVAEVPVKLLELVEEIPLLEDRLLTEVVAVVPLEVDRDLVGTQQKALGMKDWLFRAVMVE